MHRWTVVLSVVLLVAAACGGARPAPRALSGPTASSDGATATTAAAELPAEVCATRDEGFGPLQLTSEQLGMRRGEQARTYADVDSSPERPIEVCGPEGERAWLRRVTCVDGSTPFATPEAARRARRGNVGAGGRCDSIIDHYEVRCPEATYEIYMDMYMCPEGGW